MLISEQLYMFYHLLNCMEVLTVYSETLPFSPAPLCFLHFVIMPRSLINFYLYNNLRYIYI